MRPPVRREAIRETVLEHERRSFFAPGIGADALAKVNAEVVATMGIVRVDATPGHSISSLISTALSVVRMHAIW
jgi:hypothetical protein